MWTEKDTIRTLGGVAALGFGWVLVSFAATFSFVWWVGVLVMIGGVVYVAKGAFLAIQFAVSAFIIIIVVLIALAIIFSLLGYFLQHPY